MVTLTRTALVFVLTASLSWASTNATTGEKSVEQYLNEHSSIERCGPTTTSDLNRCRDNSYSFEQRRTLFGKGTCGPVAVANVAANYYAEIEPPEAFTAYMRVENGTKAEDLKKGLQLVNSHSGNADHRFRFRWYNEQPIREIGRSGEESTLKEITLPYEEQQASFIPAIVALRTDPNKSGHWTTVIGVTDDDRDGCRVVHNSWGRQYRTTCHMFRWLMTNGRSALYLTRISHQ